MCPEYSSTRNGGTNAKNPASTKAFTWWRRKASSKNSLSASFFRLTITTGKPNFSARSNTPA